MKKQHFSFLMAFLMIVVSVTVKAQSNISGKIVDESTNQGVPFVNVGLFRVSDSAFVSGAASDDKGAFTLQAVPKGEMLLKISAIGYEPFKLPVTVKGNQNLGTLKLTPGTTRLDEVVVAEKRPLFAVDGEKTLYNVSEDGSVQTGTLSDALQSAPGVEVDVEGNITLRGTSSVEIWINDRPSNLSGEGLKTYIQQMPANTIERIEVITNPSARYGSQADGIINIVTTVEIERNEFLSFGVNGTNRPSVVPWISYVFSNEHVALISYLGMSYQTWKGLSVWDQYLYTDSHLFAEHEIDTANYENRYLTPNGYLAVNFEIDTLNYLNFWFQTAFHSTKTVYGYSSLRDQYLDAMGVPFGSPLTFDYFTDYTLSGYNFNLNGGVYYLHKFNAKRNFSINLSGRGARNNRLGDYDRKFMLPTDYRKWFKNLEYDRSVGGNVEMVYNDSYSENGELSVGLTSSYYPKILGKLADTLAGDVWANDAFRTYEAEFAKVDNEAFITLQHRFGGLTVKPGVRFVSELVSGVYPDASQYDFNKHFFSVRPTLHLTYRTRSMHNFKLSYTRRISAPDAEQLSGFPVYREDSYSLGNPDLDRVYSNALEAGWTKYWNNFGSVGLTAYYRGKSNEISTVQMAELHPLYGRVMLYSYPVNMGRSYTAGFEYNMTYRPSAFFNLRFYSNLYNSYIETNFNEQDYTFNTWSYSFQLKLWTKLWNKLEVTASGYYSSPRQSLFSESLARYSVDAGLKADFFNRKMTVFVNANDIFNLSSSGNTGSTPNVESTFSAKYNTRNISVGLTFRFGKMEMEKMARQAGEDNQGPQM